MALEALDRAGIRYRIAYTSEHCGAQQAAMVADLAVGPFPHGLIRPPLRMLGEESGLPQLGTYQIQLVRARGRTAAADALAEHVVDRFHALSP
jgi:hypothetical protein